MNPVDKSGGIPNIRDMDVITTFLTRCDAVADQHKMARSTLSTRLFNDGKRLKQLAGGESDVGVRRLAAAEKALAELEKQSAN